MLETLHIKNLALVQSLEIEFGAGLNTITGETGAGKSLVIGAIQLLAGARANPSSIRKGEKSCEVAGIFNLEHVLPEIKDGIAEKLQEAELPPCEENRLLIRRIVTENGSKAYVNGSMVTAGFLKELCGNLIDLHGPHDNQTLLLNSRQLHLLDIYAGLSSEEAELKSMFHRLSQLRRQKEEMQSQGLAPEEQSLLEYQLQEIEKADLEGLDEEELLSRYKVASNSRRLVEMAAGAAAALSEGEDTMADKLSAQLRELHELAQIDQNKGAELISQLEEATENIRDIGTQFAEYAESLDIDAEELQKLERRIDRIQRLKHKYGPSLQDVLATAQRIKARLENAKGRETGLAKLAEEESQAQAEFTALCRRVSKQRNAAAPKLAAAIEGKLRALGFAKAAFKVTLTSVAEGMSGSDAVEYEFAPNVGEDMLPLKNIASSGEIARVMLAIKTVLSKADGVPILIFDEIDANIGGLVAVSVSEELKSVSLDHQVFSITHKPQIAAAGAMHYLVEKAIVGDRTNTSVRLLEGKDRLAEIVRMLGSDMSSGAAVAHAKELLGVRKK